VKTVLALAALLAAADQSSRLNLEGLERLKQNRIAEAEQKFRQSIAADPGNTEALNNLGVLLRRDHRAAAAAEILRKAARLDPRNPQIHSNLALALRESDRLAEAVTEMTKAAGLSADEAIARNLAVLRRDYGISLLRGGKAAEAIQQLELACAALPADAAAHYNLGRALQKAGRGEDAASELKIAAGINAKDKALIRAKALNNQGNELVRAGKTAEGEDRLREAAELAPQDAISQYNYGVVLLLNGKLDLGIDRLRASLAIQPEQPNAYYYLGRALLSKGDAAAAVQSLESAQRLAPKDAAIAKALENAHARLTAQAPSH
jgi:Flp pilus assembly protein TadD